MLILLGLPLAVGIILEHAMRMPTALERFPPAPAIDRIRELGLLNTLAVDVADVRQTTIDGTTGSASLLLILRGEAQLGVDLTRIRVVSSEEAGRTLRIEVPKPSITTVKVDTRRSTVYRIDHTGLWVLRPQDELTTRLVNVALLDAEQAVAASAAREDLLELARRQAEHLLTRWASAGGWTLQIDWVP